MDTLAAAHEINDLWRECLDEAEVKILPDTCPSDYKVAGVIEKYFQTQESEEQQKKQK